MASSSVQEALKQEKTVAKLLVMTSNESQSEAVNEPVLYKIHTMSLGPRSIAQLLHHKTLCWTLPH